MATSPITDVQRTVYEDMVKHAYQSAGSNLETRCRVQNVPGAGKYEFRTFGELNMVDRGQTRSRLEAQETANGLVECTVNDKVLPVLTDIFDQAKTNAPQEQAESAKAIGMAMKRERDSFLLRAMDAIDFTSVTINGETGIDLSTTNVITVSGYAEIIDKLAAGLEVFDKYEMRGSGDMFGDGTVHCAITEKEHTMLLKSTETQSSFTSDFKSLVDGKVASYAGYQFVMIGTGRGTRGLVKNVKSAGASVRACYAWVNSAVGQMVSIAPRVEATYLHQYTSNFINGILSIGAVAIDPRGIIRFNVTES